MFSQQRPGAPDDGIPNGLSVGSWIAPGLAHPLEVIAEPAYCQVGDLP